MRFQIALVTCSTLPGLDTDDQSLLEPLRRLGTDVRPAVWDDRTVDWSAFDLVVIRSTWDYTARRDEFVAWARSVPRLANQADVVEWNTDKRYLADLAAASVPVVPTTWVSQAGEDLPDQGAHVLKPSVGAGSIDAARFTLHNAHEAALAHEHVERLLTAGQTVMVQPYLHAVEERGETGLIFVGGEFSHAIVKGPMLAADRDREAGGLYRAETIAARTPTADEMDVARRALAAVPGGAERLLYARVDLVHNDEDRPTIMELELTEPSLFMFTTPGSEVRFAAAIARHATK